MNFDDAFRKAGEKGLLKTSSQSGSIKNLTSQQRVKLNRKANELFNNKEYEKAKQIFIATGYSDGLCRMGDFYITNNEPIEAMKMYFMAKMQSKYEPLLEQSAVVLRSLLKEGEHLNEQVN